MISGPPAPTPRGAPGRVRRAILGLALLILVLAGCAVWLLGTEAGARWSWALAQALIPGSLRAESLDGPLIGPFSIHDLRWNAPDGRSLAAREVGWRLEPRALFHGVLRISMVRARGVRYRHVPSHRPLRLPEAVRLPLRVEIGEMDARDVVVETGGGLIQVSRAELAARVDERLRIERLTLTLEPIELTLQGEAALHAPYVYTARLGWRGARDTPPLEGSARLQGDLDTLHVQADNETPFPVTLTARVALRAPNTFAANLTWRDARWPLESPAALHATTGSLRLEGRPTDWHARLSTRARLRPQGAARDQPLRLHAKLHGDLSHAVLDRIEARTGDEGRILLQGRLRDPRAPAWDLQGTIQDLDLAALGLGDLRAETVDLESRGRWAHTGLDARLILPRARLRSGDRIVEVEAAEVHARGRPDDLEATLTLRGHASGLPPVSLQGGLHLDRSRVTLRELNTTFLGGALSLRGALRLDAERAWRLALEAHGLDPGTLAPGWDGRLDGTARLNGSLPRTGPPRLHLETLRVGGVLQGRPLSLEASGQWDGQALAIASLSLEAAENRLTGHGRITATAVDLDLDLALARLDRLWPGLRGSLTGNARLSGQPRWPKGRLDLRAGGLGWKEVAGLDRLHLRARLGGEAAPSKITLDAQGLRVQARRWQTVSLKAQGRPAHHQATLRAQGAVDMALDAAGGWDGTRWSGRIEHLELHDPRLGPWRLQHPVSLAAAPGRTAIQAACLVREQARVCLDAQGAGPRDWKLKGTIHALPIDWLTSPRLGDRARAEGRLEARFEAQAHEPIPRAHFVAQAAGAALVVPLEGQAPLRFPLEEARAELDSDGDRARLKFRIHGPALRLQTEGEANGFGSAPKTQGRIALAVTDLGFLHALAPDLNVHAGRLDGKGRWAGTLARPGLEGDLRLSGLDVEIAELGIRLRQGNVRAHATSGGVDLDGTLRSGEGTLALHGTLTPDAKAGWPYTLRVAGRDVEFLRTAEIHAIASPELRFHGDAHSLEVTGQLEVPMTVVDLGELPPGTVQASEDQVIVGEAEPQAPRAPFDARVDVLVVLGKEVRFKGLGLETRLSGRLRILQEPGTPLRGQGVLAFQTGTYRIYGVELKLERGRLLFAGRIDNPGLDFRATRTVDEVTVGVEVTGTVEHPRTHLFSSPPMDDADILAYLIRGKPLSEAGDVDKEAMLSAALSMGLGPVTDRLAKQLGVDLTLDTGSKADDTRLGIGRRINPKLYVEYVVGLFDRTGVFKLTYKLTPHLELVTETGEQQAVDLKYRVESDTWPFTRNSRSKSSTSTTRE